MSNLPSQLEQGEAPAPPTPDPEVRYRAPWRSKLMFLMAEVVVVFLGVYGAFVLEDLRDTRRKEQRLESIRVSLEGDFQQFSAVFSQAFEYHRSTFIEGFNEPHDRGEMPRPLAIPLPAAPLNTGSWEAMLATGGFEVLDDGLIRDMESLFALVGYLATISERYNDYLMLLLVPDIDQPTEDFYNAQKRLKGKYLWYTYFHRSMHQMMQQIMTDADQLKTRLQSLK